MTPLLALCVLIGAIATVNAWIVGPAKGSLTTAEDHFLPAFFRKTNKRGVPVGMLLFQACVGSALACVFLWMETHSAAYWVLNAISSQFVLVQYALMFAAVVYLRYSKPEVQRSYQIPGGKFGVWSVATLGILACLFGFWIVFVPPAQLNYGTGLGYPLTLAISFVVLSLIPAGIALHRKLRKK